MRQTIAALALLLGGCAPPPDIFHLYIDPHARWDLAVQAAQDWEDKTPVRFLPIVISPFGCDDEQDCIFVEEETQPYFSGIVDTCSPHGSGCTLTMTDTWTSHVEVKRSLPDEKKLVAYMHELGHALGLQHHPTGTVMCAAYTCDAHEITPDDVDQYQKVRGR